MRNKSLLKIIKILKIERKDLKKEGRKGGREEGRGREREKGEREQEIKGERRYLHWLFSENGIMLFSAAILYFSVFSYFVYLFLKSEINDLSLYTKKNNNKLTIALYKYISETLLTIVQGTVTNK